MTTNIHKLAFALLAGAMLAAFATTSSAADQKMLLQPPGGDPGFVPQPYLPKFGFASFNIHGYGERVTHVRWGGLASQFGLESGDVILNMNGFPLTYQGSWNDALYNAMANGGWVQLRVRDVRTGFIVRRQLFVGDGGPIVNHYKSNGNVTTQHFNVTPKQHNVGKPVFENFSPQLQNKIIKIGN